MHHCQTTHISKPAARISKMKPIGTPCQEDHASSLLEACFSETLVQ